MPVRRSRSATGARRNTPGSVPTINLFRTKGFRLGTYPTLSGLGIPAHPDPACNIRELVSRLCQPLEHFFFTRVAFAAYNMNEILLQRNWRRLLTVVFEFDSFS